METGCNWDSHVYNERGPINYRGRERRDNAPLKTYEQGHLVFEGLSLIPTFLLL